MFWRVSSAQTLMCTLLDLPSRFCRFLYPNDASLTHTSFAMQSSHHASDDVRHGATFAESSTEKRTHMLRTAAHDRVDGAATGLLLFPR